MLVLDTEALEISIEVLNDSDILELWKIAFRDTNDLLLWGSVFRRAKRPVWEQPKQALHCRICGKDFSAIRRQHHCRHCGKAICGKHSKNRQKLPHLGYEKLVRVCDSCVPRLGHENDAYERASQLSRLSKTQQMTESCRSILSSYSN